MRFEKGKSGNPGGRPKALMAVIETARKHTPLAMRTLAEIAGDVAQPAPARVAAAIALLDRGWGKPTQPTEHTGAVTIEGVVDRPPNETRADWVARRQHEIHTAALLGPAAGSAD